jgi:hypothetical protein
VPKRKNPDDLDYAATVLLVSRAEQGNLGIGELHVPALVFPEAARDTTAGLRIPDVVFQTGTELMGVCWLDNQEITISGLIPGFTIAGGAVGPCPTAGNIDSFGWVAPIPRIDSRFGAVDQACMLPVPNMSIPPAVGARLQLTSGQLSRGSFLPIGRFPLQTGFLLASGAASNLVQAIADEVLLTAQVLDGNVTFSARSLRDSTSYPHLRLNVSADLGVWVKNIPVLDILGSRVPPTIAIGQVVDRHFEHLFRFSSNGPAPGNGYVLLAVGTCPGVGPLVQSPKCPPASFSPFYG